MPRRTTILSATLSAILIFAPAAWAESPPQHVRIGAVGVPIGGRVVGIGLVTLAKNLGYLDQAFVGTDTKVDVNYLTGTGPAINEALAQGQVDFGEYGAVPVVIGLAGGVPAKLVLAFHPAGAYIIAVHVGAKDAGIKTLKDLRGKRIAVQKGTNPHYLLTRLLESAGLTDRDVNIVNLQQQEAFAAFTGGSIDALLGTSTILMLRDRGKVRILATTAKLPPLPGNSGDLLVRTEFAQKNPDATRRIVEALVKAAWWASQEKNRTALADQFAQTGIPARYYAEQYAGPLPPQFSPLIDGLSIRGHREAAKFLLSQKLVRKSPSFDGWIDPRYLNAALAKLNLKNFWQPAP